MKVTCNACGSSYAIADQKVAGRSVKVRCKSCGAMILVDGRVSQTPPLAQDADDGDDAATRVFAGGEIAAAPAPAPAADSWSVNLSETDSRTMTKDQIVQAYQRGELADAYVWRDGMDDWKPLLEVAELADAVKPTAGATAKADRGQAKKPVAASASAARVSARQVPADLFGGLEHAGKDGDVEDHDHKLTGARNENSVLFSLDALKAGVVAPTPAAAATRVSGKPAPRAPTKSSLGPKEKKPEALEDLLSIGSGGGALFGLSSNQALLHAPPPPPDPPKPKVLPKPAPEQKPQIAPAEAPIGPPPKKAGGMMLLMLGGGALAVLATVGLVAAMAIGKAEPPATVESAAPIASSTPVETAPPAAPPPASAAEPAEPPAEPVASASSAPSAAEERPMTEAEKKKAQQAYEEAKKRAAEKKEPEKKEPEKKAEPAAGSGAAFDKSAAIAALNSAASAASGCKRPDGPTGAGRVTVTFAPSGRATTATVSGGSYGGTSVGGCIASVFRRARVPAFSGAPVTVSKSFSL